MWATYKGRASTVTLLLQRGADVNAHGNYHISSLLWAAGRGYTEIVKELLAFGAKVNVGDKVRRFSAKMILIFRLINLYITCKSFAVDNIYNTGNKLTCYYYY